MSESELRAEIAELRAELEAAESELADRRQFVAPGDGRRGSARGAVSRS